MENPNKRAGLMMLTIFTSTLSQLLVLFLFIYLFNFSCVSVLFLFVVLFYLFFFFSWKSTIKPVWYRDSPIWKHNTSAQLHLPLFRFVLWFKGFRGYISLRGSLLALRSDLILPITDAYGSGLYDPFAQFARADGPDPGHTILPPLISHQNFVCSWFQAVTAAQHNTTALRS